MDLHGLREVGRACRIGLFVGFRDMLEIPWAASLRTHNRYSPNMLLYWSVLAFACEKGYRNFDFGRSTPGEGTYRFKEQWGARPVQLYWHYWLGKGTLLPEINPHNPAIAGHRVLAKVAREPYSSYRSPHREEPPVSRY